MNLLSSLWTHGRPSLAGGKLRRLQKENFLSVALAAALNRDNEARKEVLGLFGLKEVDGVQVTLQQTLHNAKGKYLGQPDLVVTRTRGNARETYVLEVKWEARVDADQLAKYADGVEVTEVWLLSRKGSEDFAGPSVLWAEVLQALRRVAVRRGSARASVADELAELLLSDDFGVRASNPLDAVDADALKAHGEVLGRAAAVVREATEQLVLPAVAEASGLVAEADSLLDFSVTLPKKLRLGALRAAGLEVEALEVGDGLRWVLWVCLRRKQAKEHRKRLRKNGWERADTDGAGGHWLWQPLVSSTNPEETLADSANRALALAKKVLRRERLTREFGTAVRPGEVTGGGSTVTEFVRANGASDTSLALLEQLLVPWRESVREVLGTKNWSGHNGSKEGIYLQSRGLGIRRHVRCYFEVLVPAAYEGVPVELVGRVCWQFGVYMSGAWDPSELAAALPDTGWSRVTPEDPDTLYLARPVDGRGPVKAGAMALWEGVREWVGG